MSLQDIYAQVPPGYYFQSIKTNLFQRYWHTRRFQIVSKLLKSRKGRILDVGCADGVLTNIISKSVSPKAKISAVDIYPVSIDFARRKYPHIHFQTAPAEKLPYKDRTFDLITCFEMLEHVENPKRVLEEMTRVLKKNGSIIIMLPQEILLFRILWFIWTKSKGKVWDHAHLHNFYFDSVSNYFKRAGFVIKYRNTFLLNMLMIFEIQPI